MKGLIYNLFKIDDSGEASECLGYLPGDSHLWDIYSRMFYEKKVLFTLPIENIDYCIRNPGDIYMVYAINDSGESSDCLGYIFETDMLFADYMEMFDNGSILLVPYR